MQYRNKRMQMLAVCLIAAAGICACGSSENTTGGSVSFHNEGWAAALSGEDADASTVADESSSALSGGKADESSSTPADENDAAVMGVSTDAIAADTGDTSAALPDNGQAAEGSSESAAITLPDDGVWRIVLYANDGTDSYDVLAREEGEDGITLPANEFSRQGYIFRGWGLKKSQANPDYSDMDEVTDESITALYAMWEAQMYMIEFDGNGEDYGETDGMYALYNANAYLSKNGFRRKGYTFSGWEDDEGNHYEDRALIKNLDTGDTNCEEILVVDAGKPLDEDYSFRSTQGSCVYEEDGVTYLVTTASINDAAYKKGDLSHYETILNKYNLETGELVASKRNLEFDHGNSICYNPDNRHLYIAEGGTLDEYPGGVMEVDENLNEVEEYTFPILDHIWAIAYDGEHFYILGKNEQSRNTLCTLNEDLQTLSYVELDDYYSQFSSQGIAADENYLYAISAGFKTYEWKTKQRINVFTHDGVYVGVWSIDLEDEAEDITILDGYAYINTNEHEKSAIYRTELPVITMKAVWTRQ